MESEINLKRISLQDNYIKWLYDLIKSDISGNVLEVGAGVGGFTKILEKNGVNIFPIDKKIYDICHSNIKINKFDITNNPKKLEMKFDTIICMNVLEHIKEEKTAIKNMASLLNDKGTLIVMVPAIKLAYGIIDKANEHYRRYSRNYIFGLINIL